MKTLVLNPIKTMFRVRNFLPAFFSVRIGLLNMKWRYYLFITKKIEMTLYFIFSQKFQEMKWPTFRIIILTLIKNQKCSLERYLIIFELFHAVPTILLTYNCFTFASGILLLFIIITLKFPSGFFRSTRPTSFDANLIFDFEVIFDFVNTYSEYNFWYMRPYTNRTGCHVILILNFRNVKYNWKWMFFECPNHLHIFITWFIEDKNLNLHFKDLILSCSFFFPSASN